jgi:hypothetical protein
VVPKKLMEQREEKQNRQFEYPEEKAPQPRDHQYGNGIRMPLFAERGGWRMFVHLYDLPAGRVKIFLVLRKKKITIGKKPLNIALWLLTVSDLQIY